MQPDRVKCAICDHKILPQTAQSNGGLCAQCVKIPPSKRAIVAAVHAEKNPLGRAIAMYSSLIDSWVPASLGRHFGAIADPEFTAARFYAPETVEGMSIYDEAAEVGAETVDEIEHYLHAAPSGYCLLSPLAQKLKSISPAFNSAGKTVFIASMGMALAEIAWLVRYLNDRPTFDRFFRETGLTEEQVDVYNSYGKAIHQAESEN